MKRKIDIEIENKALERYPYDFVPDETTLGVEKYDKNEQLREGYIKAMEDVFNEDVITQIFFTGREVIDELIGKETTTEYFVNKLLDKIEL